MRYLSVDSWDALCDRLHLDVTYSIGPEYVGPPCRPGEDPFGCCYRVVPYGTGSYTECVGNPLAHFQSAEGIDAGYRWPSADWWDYSRIPERLRGSEHRPIGGGSCEPFLTYCFLRGREQAYVDLIENPELAHYCLDKLFALAYTGIERIYEQAGRAGVRVLTTYVAEDLGSQTALLMSRAQVRSFLLPRMKRVIDLVHSAGAYVFFHSDGAIRPVLADFIESGIDVLNPVQWRCTGMDRAELKRDFGRHLVFHGAVDNQETLAFGTVEDVANEVMENIRVLGAGGGYIIAPCHNIQPVNPPGNTVALYDTGYANGWA